MLTKNFNDIYDIAIAFITDKDTTVEATHSYDGGIHYTFTKRGLADYPYCLKINADGKAPRKRQEKGMFNLFPKNKNYLEYISGKKYVEKNYGEILLQRGNAIVTINDRRVLLGYQTKNEVGSAFDKTQNVAKQFITRLSSQEFFNIIKIAENRILAKIPTSNNTAKISNMINHVKGNQK